ncbi:MULTISPECIES: TetR/AcrR family transcriptional regulator [unclassified Micromonospora]|uniref:TetR/AcrR family transcriptional regulator n=1 Tax=unclassified Micromonospora TaxID=2617518 RepID=UPI0033211BF7
MNSSDPRVRRTRARLRAAVLELAAERELGDITIAEVAKRAGVNRATTYLHFPDLDALVADAMEEAVTQVARAAALCPLDAPRDEPPQPLRDLFDTVAANAVLYRRMLSPHGSARFAAGLRDRLAAELRRSLEERNRGRAEVPVDVHAAYLAGALTGVIANWTAGQAPAGAAETALATWRLLRG